MSFSPLRREAEEMPECSSSSWQPPLLRTALRSGATEGYRRSHLRGHAPPSSGPTISGSPQTERVVRDVLEFPGDRVLGPRAPEGTELDADVSPDRKRARPRERPPPPLSRLQARGRCRREVLGEDARAGLGDSISAPTREHEDAELGACSPMAPADGQDAACVVLDRRDHRSAVASDDQTPNVHDQSVAGKARRLMPAEIDCLLARWSDRRRRSATAQGGDGHCRSHAYPPFPQGHH